MCVVSMIMEHYGDKCGYRPSQYWSPQANHYCPYPYDETIPWRPLIPNPPTPAEIDEFRKLLERAREYDKRNNEPDCELAEKRQKIIDLAKSLGVKVDFI